MSAVFYRCPKCSRAHEPSAGITSLEVECFGSGVEPHEHVFMEPVFACSPDFDLEHTYDDLVDDDELGERIRERFPYGAWERFPRRGGGYFRATALDVTEGPHMNERMAGQEADHYLPLDEVLSRFKSDPDFREQLLDE